MPLTINFPNAKPGQTAFACAALWLVGKKFALTNGFVLACCRNEACARHKQATIKSDDTFTGATLLYEQAVEIAQHEFAEEDGQ